MAPNRRRSSRLTKEEWEAIDGALTHLLAGSFEDGDGNDVDPDVAKSAQRKVWERLP